MKKLTWTLAFTFLAGSMIGCSQGFQNGVNSSSGNSVSQAPSQTPYDPALNTIEFKGVQAQGDKVGRLLIELDRANEAVILVLPLPTEILSLMGKFPEMQFPELPGAKLVTRSDGRIAISVPLKYVVRRATFKNQAFQNQLPNGDSLTAFPSGEGANFALNITGKYKINLYIGDSAAAAFIETPDWNEVLNCEFTGLPICPKLGPWEIRNQSSQKTIGYLAFIYAKSGFNSGAYVSTVIPAEIARFMDDHLKY